MSMSTEGVVVIINVITQQGGKISIRWDATLLVFISSMWTQCSLLNREKLSINFHWVLKAWQLKVCINFRKSWIWLKTALNVLSPCVFAMKKSWVYEEIMGVWSQKPFISPPTVLLQFFSDLIILSEFLLSELVYDLN